jgi:hypothetical protein
VRRACLTVLVATAAAAAPAGASVMTLGSDMRGPASVTEARGADTAFWLSAVDGKPLVIPEDGQVTEVRIRGAAMREPGAGNDPATLVHFQSLGPAAADGSRTVHLTSGAYHMPVDQPDEVSVFRPENLCVPAGGAVAFNTIGGFRWGGSFEAPLSDHYLDGTPWRIFAGAASDTATAWYSRDNGTNNGDTFTPATMVGTELLMQAVVATGQDRSEPCGGPRRHPDGTLVDTAPAAPYLKVIKPQRPYVSRDRRFAVGVYCGGDADAGCAGNARVKLRGRVLARERFQVKSLDSERIELRLGPSAFRRVDRRGSLRVAVILEASFGTTRETLTLER